MGDKESVEYRVSAASALTILILALSFVQCGWHDEYNLISFYDTPSVEDFDRFIAENELNSSYSRFSRFVQSRGTLDWPPPAHLLRQGTDWRRLDEPAFALPPRRKWSNILPVIQLIEAEIIPAVGPVEILSAYRTTQYNAKADGASRSRHLEFQALDLVPQKRIARTQLHSILLDIWKRNGRRYRMGLGLYSGHRFHVDTAGYRRW